jgi:catecholate siderophore receptor
MRPTFRAFAAILFAGSAPVFAANTDSAAAGAANTDSEAPDEIVVTGERPEYGVKSTSTATRTNTPLKNIPQAISIISEAQIEDQDLRSIADLLTFVPGAMPGTGESNRDQMTLRGNSTTADFFVDGIRDDVQYFRDLYNLDRVEVLKGPNAMIFGRGGGGGVVNRVTKRATLGSHRDFSIAGDGEGGYRLTADLDHALSANAGVRVNGMYEDGDSFRKHVDLKRYAINPTVGLLVGSDTRIDLGYEYLRDRRTADRGVPSLNGKPVEGFDRTFFGDPDDSRSKADVHLGTFALHHDFGGGLTLRNRTLYGDYDKVYRNVYPNASPVDRDGAGPAPVTVRIAAYEDSTDRRNLFSQTDLVWDNRIAGIDQTLLVGAEFGRQKGHNQRRNGIFSSPVDVPLSDPTVDSAVAFTGSGANNDMKADIAAFYVQDQLRISPLLEIVAGLRFDRFEIDIDNLNNGQSFDRADELVSPRLGVVLKPRDNVSIYASYSRSYLPSSGDQFNSLDLTSEALKPERFDNVELGGKWELLDGLLATAAIYRLDRSNIRAPGATAGTVVLTGKQRSKGLEIGLERSVSARWQISAGYALQEAEITETTSAAPAGRKVPLVPRHQFSLWNRYNLTKQVGLGLGVVARSKAFASISNAVTLPGYTRVDAAAYYRIAPGVQGQINVENVLGADYFSTAHNDNNIAPGAPRTVRGTLRFGI